MALLRVGIDKHFVLPASAKALWLRWRRRLAIFFAGQLAVQLLAFLTGLLILRWMSEGEYAKAGVVLGFQGTFAVFVDLGIGGSLVALIGNRGHEPRVVGAYVAAARWWRRVLLVAVMPLGALAFYLVNARQGWSAHDGVILFGCIAVSLYFSGLAAWASAPLLIHQRLGALYAISNGSAIARLLGCYGLYGIGQLDAVSVTVLGTAISLVSALLYQGAARRHLQEPRRSEPSVRREIRRYVAPLVPGALFFAVQGQLSTFLIAWFGQAQGIAEVTALGRLGQLFNFLSALFAMLVIPYLARSPDGPFARRYRWSVAAVLLVSAALGVAGFVLPQALLWLLGHRYDHLAHEVSWSVLAGALGFAGGTIWCMHAARKWVFWRGTCFYIGGISLVQIGFIAWVNLSLPLNVVLLGVAVNAVALLNQGLVGWLGFRQTSKALTQPRDPLELGTPNLSVEAALIPTSPSKVQPILCVNSTLAAQALHVSTGWISPIHDWGFIRLPQDTLLGHRFNRYEVVLRARLGGLDLRLVAWVLCCLCKGYRSVYLVTGPDLLLALPFIRWLFPSIRMVTWAWIGDDVTRYLPYFRACDHVFCLTEGAVTQMQRLGLGPRASLQLWGADPAYYATGAPPERCFDVSLLGQTLRDLDSAVSAMRLGGFSLVTTERVMQSLQGHFDPVGLPPGLVSLRAASHSDVVNIFRRSRVSWVPLRVGDIQPTGYTNLAESLLCGTPVVIADSSTIPAQVLALPGVYRYRTGDASDLVLKTRAALEAGLRPGCTEHLRVSAARLLDGRALSERLQQLLR